MTRHSKANDERIQREVIAELAWSHRVRSPEIGVTVSDGIVTLSGVVGSWAERLAAREAAQRVPGVLDIADEIDVRYDGARARTDADIAEAVRSALEWDVLVPEQRIRSTVTSGVVHLEGTVERWADRDEAARCIQNLEGVRQVENDIKVEPTVAGPAPRELHRTIESALERHAHRAAKHVHIAIDSGDVTLTGRVPSWVEREAVEGAVRGTTGVRHIVNRLAIEP